MRIVRNFPHLNSNMACWARITSVFTSQTNKIICKSIKRIAFTAVITDKKCSNKLKSNCQVQVNVANEGLFSIVLHK